MWVAIGHGDSLGERSQRLLPDAHVVKTFTTVDNAHMFRPDFPGGPPDMFICGDSDEAKGWVRSLLRWHVDKVQICLWYACLSIVRPSPERSHRQRLLERPMQRAAQGILRVYHMGTPPFPETRRSCHR